MKKKAPGWRTRRTRDPAFKEQVALAKIGQLALENEFLEGALTKAGLLSVKP